MATWNDKFFAAVRRGEDPFRAIDLADEWLRSLCVCIRCGWTGVRATVKKPCPRCGGAVERQR